MTMGDIIRRSADKFPGKNALILGEQQLTYEGLNARVNCLADSLMKMGVKRGERIAVVLHNCFEFYEIYYAAAKCGAIFVPINNLLKAEELKQIINYIEPRVLFFDPDFHQVAVAKKSQMKSIAHEIALRCSSGNSYVQYEELMENGNPKEPDATVNDDDVMSIFLTSGTTGIPKGAMRTHRHVFINSLVGAIECNLQSHDRAVILFPFYHVSWEDNMRHVLMGNTIVIKAEGSFDPKDVLVVLSEMRITTCQFVPTMINALMCEESNEGLDLSQLRLMVYAASPMPVELLKRAMERFRCGFMQMYGQTETGPITTVLKPEDHILEGTEGQMARLASAGRPALHYEVKIVDEDGNDVARGGVGEIVVRSESMTVGYWRLPEETSKTIKNGWLHTGDFGRMDHEGYVFIIDRKNDLIISGGKNIYPREIEEVLYKHEAILEAAVIGVPDNYWGESVKALVVLKDKRHLTEEEIVQFCRTNLANYKKPRSVEFRLELPKSPVGKILKRVIRETYWKDKERKV